MQEYVGTKIINAKPMNRLEYNNFRNWILPLNEDGRDEGFLVEYKDGGQANTIKYSGYVSWSPKEVFERTYKKTSDVEQQLNALAELERFQTDRLLHKNKFDLRIATMNILEELLEAHGVGDNKERELVQSLYDGIKSMVKIVTIALDYSESKGYTFNHPTIEDQVDAFCDIQVFAGGEIGKLGYSNEQCLIEVGKEINSRTGEIVNGKFEKYKTEEAMSKWYKADFSGCKLCI